MRPCIVLALAAALVIGSVADASSQTLTTDRPDYAPGEIAFLTGTRFAPGEEVTVQVTRMGVEDPGYQPDRWTLTADAQGGFETLWMVCYECSGATLVATAEGLVSGLYAQVTFTDAPKVQTVTLGAQSPSPLAAGGSATYLVSVRRDGANDSFNAALAVTTALPAGTSATFSPASLAFPSQNPNITLTSTLTISSNACTTPAGTSSFTVRASRNAGDFATATRSLVVAAESTPPTVSCPAPTTVQAGAGCQAAVPNVLPGVTASDNCTAAGSLFKTQNPAAGTLVGLGTHTITVTVTDAAGNSGICSTSFTVEDSAPPSIALSGSSTITVECHSPFGDPGASASDLCAGDLAGSIQVSGSVDANTVGSYVLTYSVNDGHGNSASVTRTVQVVDTTPPALSLTGASSMTVECHSPFGDPGASASDLCAGDLAGSIQVSGSVDANTVGSYVLTYSVNDGHGNSASVTRTVQVVDTTPPSLSLAGASSMTVECHSPFGDPGASASDLCAGDLAGSIQVSGSVDANTVGSYTLTYSVNDGHGNSASVTRTVQVVDTTPPSLTVPHAVEGFTGPGATSCGALVTGATLGQAVAGDLCGGTMSVQCVGMPAGNLFPVGVTTLTYSATDPSGNTASATQTVTVVDNTAPTLTVPVAVSAATGPGATACGTVVTDAVLGSASASDNCPGVSLVRSGMPAGNLFPVGTTTLTYMATDAHGNTTTLTQTVVVTDNTPPTLTVPGNKVQLVDGGRCTAAVSFAAGVSDNCAGASVVYSPASGFAFPIGTTTVTCTATDAAGNQSSGSFTVTVQNPTPVVTLTGPASGTVLPIGTSVALAGTFTDNGGDTHSAQWSLDGTSVSGAVNEATGAVTGSYTFSTAGVYLVKLTVTDQCGGAGVASQVSGLDAMVVVYDPNGGFVTGGGWINSPAGAYVPDAAKVGKANFGFVSKYKKGANTPSGETEFQFKAADLNFRSTSYEWLVVAGARAQYKGSGTINGTGDYGFLLTGVDGQVNGGGGTDRFRMKIVSKVDGAVIYDNQLGAADDDAPTTAIGGGSIVIHTTKGAAATASAMEADGNAPGVGAAPVAYALAQNAPNPFNEGTQVAFELPEKSHVRLTVYDVAGREVASLANEAREPGFHAVNWSGRGSGGSKARGGVYFVRIVAESLNGTRHFSSLRKMIRVE